ncbi:MAG: T9SS type A sorting domain-containing protein [Bacteroidota bacterium]|nr:T9SS type A sorting domain-containing protein [Bacteroidota bacterium]
MKKFSKFTTALSSLLIFIIFTISFTPESSASHYRYGHLNYERDAANCDSVIFTLINAFRRSAYCPSCNIGDVFTETIGATQLFFGDGNFTPVLQYRVIAINFAEDYLVARALEPGSLTKESISHNYSGSSGSFFLAEINSFARSLVEINHPNESYRVSALLWKGNCNSSPISSLPPIVNLTQSPASTFVVPVINIYPDKYIRFRYATAVEMGVSGSNPFPAFGGAGSIDPLTGVITWNTTTAIVGGLYSTQVIIEQRDTLTDTVKGRVAVDWLTRIRSSCPNDTIKPVFVPPTPACGSIIEAIVGVPISFTIKATDNSGESITLSASGLPPGATLTPASPSGNPVSAVFDWTPTTLIPYVVTFTAIDSCGNQDICVISFDVPLPVELASFSSMVTGNDVTLNWTTVIETNNSRFEIERATGNSQEWSNVGSVQGNGNSTLSNSYSFTDRVLNIGIYNYRIKQIDFNGNFEYYNLTGEVVIGVPSGFSLSQNYPNPFNPSTKIDFELPNDGNVNISVYDNSGKQVSTLTSGFKNAGYYTIQFNAANLSSGVYYYKIQFASGDQSFEKVMKMALLK